MTTVAQLTIEMAANVARLRTDMQASRRIVETSTKQMASAALMARNALGGIGAGLSVRAIATQFLTMADSVTVLNNRLKLAHGTVREQTTAYAELYRMAQSSRVSFTELGTTYAQIARNGGPQSQILTVTGAIANAMTISGGSAQGMNAALVQLGQGMASGVLRGEELNSVMEQTPRLARAIADGLGVSIAGLREMGKAGELTTEAVTRALLSQAAVLKGEVAGAVLTVAQAYTVAGNAATMMAGQLDKSTGASGAWAREVQAMGAEMQIVGETIKASADRGEGSLKQLANAAGVVAGRASFGAIEIAANSLNGTINFLTGGLLNLNTNVRLLPDNLRTAREQMELIPIRLKQARAEYDTLAERLKVAPDNIYLKSELHQLSLYIARLREAQARQEDLQARALRSIDGVDMRAEDARMGRHADRAKTGTALDELRLAYSGLRGSLADYTKDLNAAQAARQHGLLTERAYIDLVSEIAKKYGQASTSGAAAARALREAERELAEQRKRDLEVGELRNKLAGERWEAEQKAVQQAIDSFADLVAARQDAAIAAQDELAQQLQANEAIGLSAKAVTALEAARLRDAAASLKRRAVIADDIDFSGLMGDALRAEAQALLDLASAKESGAVRQATEDLRKEQAEAWERTWNQVSQSFTDALMQGGRSVKEYLIGLFRTLVLRPILAPIGGAVSSVLGGGASAAQGGGSAMGSLNTLSSLYNAVTSGFSTMGNMVGSIGSSFQYGTTMFSQQSQMLAAQEAGMGTLSGSMGSAASALGGAMVGVMLGKMISGGYSAIGKSGNTAVVAGTAIGSIFGPLGAAIGGVIGGIVNVAFGRKLKSSGIQGTFGGEQGFQGNSWELHKGGWFRSDKWKYNPLDEGVRSEMALQYNELTTASEAMADALGLSSEAIKSYYHSFEITTKGLSADQVTELLAAEFQKMANAQALLIMGTGSYIRRGEEAVTTLARLSSSLTTVNQIFDTLGTEAYTVGLVGADMASQLADLFGGLQNFANATDAYYQAYYTDAERAATTTRQMTEAMVKLNLQMPTSREGFRSLVEAQDLNTEAGRQAYAALMALAPVFNGLMGYSDQLQEALLSLGSTIVDEVQRLRGLLTTDSASSMAALQAQFATGTAAARAGDQTALERLPFLSQAIEEAARLQAVTAADVALVRGQLAASLSATLDALGLDVPQFAAGGAHRGGLRLVGERGPEIEATGPARYFNASQTAAMLGGGNDPALLAELQALRAEVSGMRTEVRADVVHNAKTARILSRVTRDGEALVTVSDEP